MMAVLAGDGGRQAEHEARLGPAGDQFEAVGREVMAFVDDQVPVVADPVVDDSLADEALDQGDIEVSREFPAGHHRGGRSPSPGRSRNCERRSTHCSSSCWR